jgi:pilus assembly protein CpaB
MMRTDWLRRWLHGDLLLALIALSAGIAAAVLARSWLETQREAAERAARGRHALREVIVASRDVPGGHVLSPADLAVRAMPEGYLPPDVRGPQDVSAVVGRALSGPALRGDALTARNLRAPLPPAAADRLLEGDRAVTIAVDETNAVAGLVGPGDRIDLLYLPPDAGGTARVLPLVEQVQVLAAGSTVDPASSDPSLAPATLTLRVSADDAARIALAQRAGRLTVVLRPRSDDTLMSRDVRTSGSLLPRPAPSATRRAARGIEFLVGGGGQPLLARSAAPLPAVESGPVAP